MQDLLFLSFVGTPIIVLASLKILQEVVDLFEYFEEKVQDGGDIELQ
jgi:uncharacterized protein YpmS